jgi:hypothetical protein
VIGRSRSERKAAAVLRAQLSLKHALERIDYQEDVIKPKLLEIRELEQYNTVSIEAGPEDAADGIGG